MKAFLQHDHKDSDKRVLQALIPFIELKDKVLFTCKANPNSSIQKDAKALAKENVDYYQRRIDEKRLKAMQEYIIGSILDERDGQGIATLFPTSLILAVMYDQDLEVNDNCICDMSLSDNVFIVDGQHRMMAMMKLYDTLVQPSVERTDNISYVLSYLEQYKFNCTILVNYDLWEQSQVFINVNFKQKPVNKSLYYEVFGSEYQEQTNDPKRNIIYHAHTLVKRMNTYTQSPFYNRIKMLGTGTGYVSQAFFVESLMLLFKPQKAWHTAYGKDIDLKSHTAELLTFFFTVKEVLDDYWPKDSDTKGTLVCKTTGVGAFVRLMAHLHQTWDDDSTIIFDLSATKEGDLCPSYRTYVKKKLQPLQSKGKEIFGEESKFQKASGKATESHLFKTMLDVISKAERNEKPTATFKTPFNLENIGEQLQEYLWQNQQSDLDELGHHYEFDTIDNVRMDRCTATSADSYRIFLRFDSSVTIYLDNEDDSGISYSFPTTAELDVERKGRNWHIETENMKIKFETSEY